MPFETPSLTGRREEMQAGIEARLPGADARLRHSTTRVMAEVFAGGLHAQDEYLRWQARQLLPDTSESAILDRHGRIWGVTRKPAAAASGTIVATGTVDALIPAAAELRRSDGTAYRVTTATAIGAEGSAEVPVTAVLAGAAGNLDAGAAITFSATIEGVESSAVVAAGGIAAGADVEADEDLRVRVLSRIRLPPHGGNAADYVRWALEVPGVTRAWAYRDEMGPGSVTVRFMMDAAYPDGIPQGSWRPAYTGDVGAVYEHIAPLRPVTADLYVVAPIPVPLDVTVRGLSPNTAAVRQAVALELADTITFHAEPGREMPVSKLWEAVSRAAGEDRHEIMSPSSDVAQLVGRIFVPGEVTFAG